MLEGTNVEVNTTLAVGGVSGIAAAALALLAQVLIGILTGASPEATDSDGV
jgi:hypothetical protein